MQALVSIRNPQVSAHCEATYAVLAEYARDGHIQLDPYVNEGVASALLRLSDAMEMLVIEGWDDWTPAALETACVFVGGRDLLPCLGRSLVAFREWLFATGRASDRHLADLRSFVATLPKTDTMSGTSLPRASRAYRRAARGAAKRMHRKAN
ncbi:MAG: hypothetical protein J0L92_09825 [Deltaproteobacteria bacterium]|nr:hypothetical protein [Deltaproteobacteria bacterium]